MSRKNYFLLITIFEYLEYNTLVHYTKSIYNSQLLFALFKTMNMYIYIYLYYKFYSKRNNCMYKQHSISQEEPNSIHCIVGIDNTDYLVTCGRYNHISVWNKNTLNKEYDILYHIDTVDLVIQLKGFNNMNSIIASASRDFSICVIDIISQQLLQQIPLFDYALAISYYPGQSFLLASSNALDSSIKIIDIIDSNKVSYINGNYKVKHIEFLTENVFICATSDNAIKIWDVPTKKLLNSIKVKSNALFLKKHSDNKHLFSCHKGYIQYWYIVGNEMIQSLFKWERSGLFWGLTIVEDCCNSNFVIDFIYSVNSHGEVCYLKPRGEAMFLYQLIDLNNNWNKNKISLNYVHSSRNIDTKSSEIFVVGNERIIRKFVLI